MPEKIYWIAPDSTQVDLTDGAIYMVRQGINGRHMPTFTFTSQKMFTYPGEVLRNVSVNKREITLPITVYGTSAEDLRANLRALQGYFDPMQGLGALKWVSDDVSPITRQLSCYYESGMEFLENTDTGNYKTRIFTPTFIAHQPYWFDPTPVSASLALSGNTNVTNYGDVDTWPSITVQGSVREIVITNNTTGKVLDWLAPCTLANSDYMFICTTPGQRRCTVNTQAASGLAGWPGTCGVSSSGTAVNRLTPTSSMNFNLQPGVNSIGIAVSGSDGNTSCTFQWWHSYNGI
jgi:phage-related protein